MPGLREVVEQLRRIRSADPRLLDVDDLAGPELEGPPRIVIGPDRFVEADGRAGLRLHLGSVHPDPPAPPPPPTHPGSTPPAPPHPPPPPPQPPIPPPPPEPI